MSAVKCAGGCGLVADDEDMWQVTRHPSREVETTTVRTHDGHEWEVQTSGPERVYLCATCPTCSGSGSERHSTGWGWHCDG